MRKGKSEHALRKDRSTLVIWMQSKKKEAIDDAMFTLLGEVSFYEFAG